MAFPRYASNDGVIGAARAALGDLLLARARGDGRDRAPRRGATSIAEALRTSCATSSAISS